MLNEENGIWIFFFFQAEDGIRDLIVTGVQTCALPIYGAAGRRRLTEAFETAYREKFALTPPGVAVEFLNIRVSARAPVSGSEVMLQGRKGTGAAAALKGRRPAYFSETGGVTETAVYDRYRLGVGDEIQGPAVVEEEGSTLVVGPGATARVAPTGNMV